MDGIGCQIVLANVLTDVLFCNSSFVNVDKMFNDKNFEGFKHIFVTDIYPNNPELIKKYEDRIVMLDHHGTSMINHCPSKMRFVDDGQCATALVKNFVENYFEKDLSFLNELVYHINDYDLWIHESPKSKELNIVFDMYKEIDRTLSMFRKRFIKGNVTFTQDEINYINFKQAEYVEVFNKIEVVDFEKINACIVLNTDKFLNDICDDLLKKHGYSMVFFRNTKNGHTSVRHNIIGINIGRILDNLGIGGGHEFAAGINILDVKLLMQSLKDLDKFLYENYPKVRRV
jgi:oligoribonuclease NrnB/cAMP/cGMP phosphodiesterase (DHH superfamily)